MKAIHKRLIKLQAIAEEERRKRAPGIAELLRQRYAGMRPKPTSQREAPRTDKRDLSMSQILRMRYAKEGRSFDEFLAACKKARDERQSGG